MEQPVRNPSHATREPFAEGRRAIRVGLVIIAIAFGGFGTWASTAPLAGAVIMPGSIKVSSYRKTVQHLEGGIVKQILVRQGDRVTEGQPLVVLDNVKETAMVDVLRIQLDAALARATRLNAEKNRQDHVGFESELAGREDDPRVAGLIKVEKAAFKARRQLIDSQAALLRTQIKQIDEEMHGLEGQIHSADQYIRYTKEELRMNEDLRKQNFVAYPRVLALKRQLAEKEEKRGEFVALLAQARQKISERELRIVTLYDNYVREATDELKDVEKQVADLRERLRPSQDQLKRSTIVAPIAGVVVDLKIHTVGGVITPGEPLMDIVPADSGVMVEGKVKVEDIDEVQVGASVDVQLSAYSRRTTPKVAGTVTYVSADSLTEPTTAGPASYYLVQIDVDKRSLAEIGNLPLTPGMPVEAFIKTRERTMVQYLLEPVTDTLRRALRES